MQWTAFTSFAEINIGTTMLIASEGDRPSRPPGGVNLLIDHPDGTKTITKVLSGSAEELVIVLEATGSKWLLTPHRSSDYPIGVSGFPGTEWTVRAAA